MKISKKLLIITTLLCFLPCVVGLIMWSSLPTSIPAHWNAQGEIDSYMPKAVVVFALPAFLAVVHLVCHFATKFDKRSKNYSKALFVFVCWLIPVLSNFVMAVVYMTALGKQIDVPRIITALLGVMFIIVGNYLPKCKQNLTMGIRLPWTLKSEENWNKTHRLSGWLGIICGIVCLVLGIINKPVFVAAVIPLAVVVPVIYSFVLHKKKN